MEQDHRKSALALSAPEDIPQTDDRRRVLRLVAASENLLSRLGSSETEVTAQG